jgi:hypothetical protein
MTAAAYADLNDGTHVMDGHRARNHLTRALGMRTLTREEFEGVAGEFDRSRSEHAGAITGSGEPTVIVPPAWYWH